MNKGVVTEEDIQNLIIQANQQSERKIQLGQQDDLELTAVQSRELERLRQLEQQRKQQQQDLQEQRERQQQQQTSVINQIRDAMKRIEQQNQQAQEEKQQQAVDRYLETLTDDERQRFMRDRKNNQTKVPPTNENDYSGGGSGDGEPNYPQNPLRIKSIAPITAIVNWREEYTLPSIVVAEMSNQSRQEVNVTWNATNVDTTSTGVQTFNGKVVGFSGEVMLSLIVEVPLETAVPLEPNKPIRFRGGIIVEPDETIDGQEILMHRVEIPYDNGLNLLSNQFWFEAASGDQFDSPVTLSLPLQGGANLPYVGLYSNIFDTQEWESVLSTTDTENGRIQAEVFLFNRYFGVFEAKAPQIKSMYPTGRSDNEYMEIQVEFDLPVVPTEESNLLWDHIKIRNSENEEFLSFETTFQPSDGTNEDIGILMIHLNDAKPSEEYTITIPANFVQSLHGVPNKELTSSFVTQGVTLKKLVVLL